jgi:hypothetical protein
MIFPVVMSIIIALTCTLGLSLKTIPRPYSTRDLIKRSSFAGHKASPREVFVGGDDLFAYAAVAAVWHVLDLSK